MTMLYALDRRLILWDLNEYQKRVRKSKNQLRRRFQIILELIALKTPLKLHVIVILFSAVV